MISMNQKQEVILRHTRQGHGKKKIARELKLDVKTVRRYLQAHEQKLKALTHAKGEEAEALISLLTEAPKYDSSGRQRHRLTREIQDRIDELMEENAVKRRRGLHKQLMKKVDMHECLRREGHRIGYTSVCNYVRRRQASGKEAFIRQHYDPGGVCEFDWGEVSLNIDGQERLYQLAVFTAAYSNYRWAMLFDRQDTASFQQAHALFFAHVGGVYGQLEYDNMRVVIRRFVGRTEKEPTEGLLRLSMYYHFDFRFCNVGRGNEKGHVERSVEYVRRKAFAQRDHFSSRAEANAWLQQRCGKLNGWEQRDKGQSAVALLEQERSALHPCPAVAFECAELRTLRVDKYSTVNLGKNYYSVPEALVGQLLDVKVYPSWLVVFYEKKEQCRHERRYTSGGWYLHLAHYLATLERKPGALAHSAALRQSDERLRRIHDHFFKNSPKTFIELLHYQRFKNFSLRKLEEVIRSLHRLSPQDISLDKIKVLCERQPDQPRQRCEPGTIEVHAQEQLQLLAQLTGQADSFTVQTPVL